MKRGDFVRLELEGHGIRGMVVLASKNEVSLAVMFDGMLGGFVNMILLMRDEDGVYRDLTMGREVRVTMEAEDWNDGKRPN